MTHRERHQHSVSGHTLKMSTRLNLVLLGKKGVGKSVSGNTILGREGFASKKSSKSVTRDVAVESGTVDGLPVTLYDTPGFGNPELSEEEIQQMINEKVLQKCKSGHCVFLLVIKTDILTEEEVKTVEKIEKILGQTRMEKTWILFTKGDELDDENMTIKDFLDECEPLTKLVQKYDQRYHVFNNKNKGRKDQVKILLTKILQTSVGLEASDGGRLTRRIPDRPNNCDEPETPAGLLSSRRIVLLGKTGVGKSAAGNTILGQKVFISEQRMNSVSRECLEKCATVSGRKVSVYDTPGFFDTQMKPEELMKEIARSVYLSSPGPHTFLIVFPVNIRFTDQEQQITDQVEILFGEEVLKYSIILFTHGDLLKRSVEELIGESSRLRHLIQKCGGRYHVFNNEKCNSRDQVNDLLQKIDTVIEQNDGHYSNQMFEDARRYRQEEEKRRQGKENQICLAHSEFDKFYKQYEPRFRLSAFALGDWSYVALGAIIGAAIGLLAGPVGVVVGTGVGAGIGAFVGADVGGAVRAVVSAVRKL